MNKQDCTHFAFWPYDRFPFCIGSEVFRVEVTSNCKVRAYAPSYQSNISPHQLLDNIDQGIDIRASLDNLQTEFQQKQADLLKEYKRKAIQAAPFLKDFPAYK